jgi:hypothetical protein
MLGAGTAQNLQHVVPGQVDASLPVDTMPSVWRSKYPIYYLLAGAASISGLDPVNVFPGVAAVLVALTACAFLLFARYALRAGPGTAVLAMGLVASDRVVAHLGLHPYFNQLWGTLALPLMLIFGLRFIREPTRREGILLLLFLAFGLAAYPLMILFPAVAFGTALWLARRERSGIWACGLRLPKLPLWAWIPIGIVAFPATLGLIWAITEKVVSASDILLGGQSLAGWSGDLKQHLDPDWFFGVTGVLGYVGFAVVLGLAVAGFRRTERSVGLPLQAVVAVALALVVYFRIRPFGQYFEFKVVAFLFPLLLTGVAVYLGGLAAGGLRSTRGLAAAAVAAGLMLAMGTGLAREVRETPSQAPRSTFALRDWAKQLPAGSSVRLDVLDDRQLWGGYMLASHPVVSLKPIVGTTYPAPPKGRKADYILTDARLPRTGLPDAVGAPLFENDRYRIYRLDPKVPGPDRSSQRFHETPGIKGGS